MEPIQDNPQEKENQESSKRELYRQSLDKFMIYNPTEYDYVIKWDQFNHVVPNKNKDMGWGNGKRIVERYLMETYFREMKNKMITESADKELRRLQKDLEKKGNPNPLLTANETMMTKPAYRTDNPEVMIEYRDMLVLGLVEKYGIDDSVASGKDVGKIDLRSAEELVLAGFNKPYEDTSKPKIEDVTN